VEQEFQRLLNRRLIKSILAQVNSKQMLRLVEQKEMKIEYCPADDLTKEKKNIMNNASIQ